MRNHFWTAKQKKTLRALVAEGKSALQIAKQMGLASRNCVIGKCSRMKLKLGETTDRLSWTPERDDVLREMWITGLSTFRIAGALKLRSTGAVSWRAQTLGLDPRCQGSTIKVKPTLAPVAMPAPEPEPPVVKVLAMPKPASVPRKVVSGRPMRFLEAEYGRCHFPLWGDAKSTPVEFLFYCGDPSGQSSYCPHHASRCYGIGSRGEREAHRVKVAA